MADPLLQGYYSLSKDVNKVGSESDTASVVSELLPELDLSMTDDELVALKRDWIKQWEPYSREIEKQQKENEEYWLGAQYNPGDGKRPIIDNLIFESLETFLPIATRPKPDPLVEGDGSPQGQEVAKNVRHMLAYLADDLAYNLKVKQVARYWALYMLGVIKVGWSMKENDITCAAIRPQKLILDPKSTIQECEYDGYYVGEYLEDMASDLVLRFPKKTKYITDKVHGKMGTTVQYLMWTTDDYVFWTLDDEVLAKNKNPHWNYDQEQPGQMDEMGTAGPTQQIPGKNHFKNRKKPYVFLSIFSLGKQPHDEANLVRQNIPLQDLINKRLVQMDKNADNANGGLAVSGDAFTEEQASKAAKAKRNGGVVWVPTGPVQNAIVELNGAQIPNFVYESLVDYRNELRNIFGTRGSTAQGTIQDKTVRGKMQIKGQDSDRIGGGISTYLEQFTDNVFNWFVQLMYVYYDEPHYATVLGKERAQEYIQLTNTDFSAKLLVGVKEGSMIPQDPITKREEALMLWSQHGIDPITFFDRLEFPNPRESAKNLFLWLSDPVALFPDLAQQQGQKQQEKPPSVAINFKDLPPEGKVQAAGAAGIQLNPASVIQQDATERLQETQQQIHGHALQSASATQAHQHKLQLLQIQQQHQAQQAKVQAKKPKSNAK